MVALVNRAMEELSVASSPGQFLVDIIPICMSPLNLGTLFSKLCSTSCPRMVSWCRISAQSKAMGPRFA